MLPELCCTCKKLKDPSLGKWIRIKGQMHRRKWHCFVCLELTLKPEIRSYLSKPSPLEIEARKALIDTGYHFVEEFSIGKLRYDFAIKALRLILEIDSARWHKHPSRKARDKKKDALAESQGWLVKRISSRRHETISFLVNQAVNFREQQLSVDRDY